MKTKELTKNEMVLINQNPLNARIIVWFYTHCGYAPYQYQIDKIVDLFNEFKKTGKIPKIVLAAAPNAGKTNMSICFIDLLLEDNPNLRTLILVHNTSILRKNYFDRILLLKPKFVLTAQNLKAGDEFDGNSNVVVTMPSTIQQRKILPEFDILIVDEAHHFYESKDKRTKERGGTMIQKIIKKINPKYHILLTGTPSIFIKLGGYKILPITGMEIYEAGNSAEVYVEHSTSSYFVKNTDFTKGSDDVKINFQFEKDETEKSLEDVVSKILHRLLSFRNPKQNSIKQLVSPILDWDFFKFNLKRTIIACRNIQQAHIVAKYFTEKGIKTIQSDYESDSDNKLIEKFLEDKTYKILVVVQKGVLGLDDETIEIAVDMTLSKNIDRVFQFYNRVTRKLIVKGKSVKKLFIKIVPSNRVDEYKIRLTGVICMMHKEWYTKFNGKNFLDMKLPKESKPSNGSTSGGTGTTSGNKPKGQEYLGIPAPENMFQYLTSNRGELLNAESWTETSRVVNLLRDYNDETRLEITNEMIEELYSINKGCYLKDFNFGKNSTTINKARKLGIHNDLMSKYDIKLVATDWSDELIKEFIKTNNVIKFNELYDYPNGSGLCKYLRENNLSLKYFPDILRRHIDTPEMKKEMTDIVLSLDVNGSRIYSTISDLQKKNTLGRRAYKWFSKFNYLDELRDYFVSDIKPKNYWTKEKCVEESLRNDDNGNRIYKTSIDFRNSHKQAWRICNELGILYTECQFPITPQAQRYLNEKESYNKTRKDPTKKEIIDLQKKYPNQAIKVAEELGVTFARYKRIAELLGVYEKKETCQLTKEQILNAQKKYNFAVDVAKHLGVEVHVYKKRAKKLGLYKSASRFETSQRANNSKK